MSESCHSGFFSSSCCRESRFSGEPVLRHSVPATPKGDAAHFLGKDDNYEPTHKRRGVSFNRQKRDLEEGDEQVFLIETTTGLKYEKKHALEIFDSISLLNDLLIKRDDIALNSLEKEFSEENKSALCFDGNKVSVWKNSSGLEDTWSVDYYLKNFVFRFEYEPETRHLIDENELNKWLTFRFLKIRDGLESQDIYRIKKGARYGK